MRPPPASPATPASTAPGAATAMVPALADAAFAVPAPGGTTGVVDGLQESADTVVEGLHHRGVERVMLWVLRVGLGLEVFDIVRPGVPRAMDREGPVVQVERLSLMGRDILRGFLGHAVFDVHADLVRDGRVFDGLKVDALDGAFERARKKSGLDSLRFHDLRHIGATLCARAGMSANHIRMMLGHKTLFMSLVYVNLVAQDASDFISSKMQGSVVPA